MPVIVSRTAIARACSLLFAATLIIVIDVRLPSFDLLADVVGGVLVLVAVRGIHDAIRGADRLRRVLVMLAVLALPVTMLETLTPATGVIGLLGLSQLLGTIVLARLLSEALRDPEPALAATWRMAYQLTVWLALAPYLGMVLSGLMSRGAQVQSPVVILLVAIAAIPLVVVLQALWRTRDLPAVDVESPAPA